MMYNDLLKDIEKLIGLQLHSIRPGAELTIEAIEREKCSLLLRNAQGNLRKRSLDEIRNLWSELQKKRIVHVDGFLHGSGSSRNQPETILANLPYIEWLKYNGKKHLAYVEKSTHEFGTLREMNPVEQIGFCELLSKIQSNLHRFSYAVVTNDIKQCIDDFNKDSSYNLTVLEQGAYALSMPNNEVLFLSADKYKLPRGVYPVLHDQTVSANIVAFKLNNILYYAEKKGEINVLLAGD
ncbi:hypothetical protein [uncultured Fibrobacter sp.]|uniref:hypothetical protein n=1 Tax=uncultured Fibrobacter sp. TaxID=261512 RepID=UPI0025FF56B7|nr:hypothetical protein [uncultured Fibrobacter sp.]